MKNLFLILLIFFILIIGCSDPSDDTRLEQEDEPPLTDDPLPPIADPDAKEITFSLFGNLGAPDEFTGPVIASCISNNLLYTGCYSSEDILRIYDLADPLNPNFLGELYINADNGLIADIFVRDNIVFCAMANDGIAIVDANDPYNPKLLGVNKYIDADSLFVQGNYLFCGRPAGHFYIFDISDLTNPKLVAKIESVSSVLPDYLDFTDIYVSGDYAYVTGTSNSDMYLAVVGIKDPYNPSVKKRYIGDQWTLNSNTSIQKLIIKNNYLYLATWDGLVIFDISDPFNITDVGFYNTPWSLWNIVIEGNYAYCSMYDIDKNEYLLTIIDIQNPFLPAEVSTTPAGIYSRRLPFAIHKSGADIFAYCFNKAGIEVINVSDPAATLEAAFIPYYNSFVSSTYEKILIDDDYAFMTKGDDADSMVVFDISNPAAPFITGRLPAHSTGVPDFKAVDMLLYENYAYLKIIRDDYSSSEGLAIVNVDDKNNPVFVGFVPGVFYVTCFNVFENTMYISDRTNNILTFDLANPQNPVQTAQFQLCDSWPNYRCSSIYINREDSSTIAYIVYRMDTDLYGLKIFNMTNPGNPIVLSELIVERMNAGKLFIRNNTLFVMSNFYYYNDYGSLFTVNIADKENPVLLGKYNFPIDTYLSDMCITDDFAILSMLEEGICALDISNPARPLYSGGINHRNDNICVSIDIKQNYVFVANGTSDESLYVLEYSY